MSNQVQSVQVGNRFVEGSGGGALGVVLIQALQLIGDHTYRDLAISAVPIVSALSGYLIHACYLFLAKDWPLIKMNRAYDKMEKRLRRQINKQNISEEERRLINEKLVVLQEVRSDSEISRITKIIEAAPESNA
ncbi:hypothetical protein [Marinobacter sp. X15-166B]|uniref:hypothetical protein n=1 Tax=Marinobacter sp. X15-166B TaxID=1897620 RepID=UPI00085C36A0|nr:hypothetical protein [Marinobacter sp. X15-166B]OEY66822.1 hypothetical protein BG841_10390 [Marinobacter sp. X15-166B]